MAQKTYTKYTLNGNWFEERAPPLAGVVADYGFRDMGTTAGRSHRPPAKNRTFKRQLAGKPFRCGMVTADTLAEAKMAWAGGEGSGSGFGALVATHAPDHEARMFETSAMAAFGAAKKRGHLEEKKMARERAEAVARPREAVEAKEKHMHPIGEVLKTGADPQQNTLAQRAWLYGGDAGVDVVRAGRPAAKDKGYMSLAITGTEKPVAKGRRAIVTLNQQEVNARKGTNIWADEIA